MGFTSTLIQYLTHTCVHMCTHIQHTQGPIDWHMYRNIMLPPPVVFTEAITVSHRRKLLLYQKFNLCNKSTVPLFFKITHMLNLHICRLDWIRLSPYWEIQKTDRNNVNEQNTCGDIKKKLVKDKKWYLLFRTIRFANPFLFMGKIWTPLLGELRELEAPFIKPLSHQLLSIVETSISH